MSQKTKASVRPCRQEDIPSILRLIYTTMQESYDFIDKSDFDGFFKFHYSERILEKYLTSDDDDLWVIDFKSCIIGFLHASFDLGDLYCVIHSLFVDTAYQRSGYGKILCETVIEKARKANISRIHLGVYEENVHALKIYKKFGFQIVKSVEDVVGSRRLNHLQGYVPMNCLIFLI